MNLFSPGGSNDDQSSPPGKRNTRTQPHQTPWFWILLIAFLVINFILGQMMLPAPNHVSVPYSVFEQQVSTGNVSQITSEGDAITGQFKKRVTWPASGPDAQTGLYFDTRVAAFSDPALLPLLKSKSVLITPTNP